MLFSPRGIRVKLLVYGLTDLLGSGEGFATVVQDVHLSKAVYSGGDKCRCSGVREVRFLVGICGWFAVAEDVRQEVVAL